MNNNLTDNNLTDSIIAFLDEFNLDRKFAIDDVDLFRDRFLRRIKKLAILDVDYFWENTELLEKGRIECCIELKSMLYHFQELEEYELCQVLVEEEPKINKIYDEIYLSKMDQVKNINMDEIFE